MNDIPSGFTIFRDDLQQIEAGIVSQLANLKGARFFITGGTGFFGIWMLEGLLWAIEKNSFDIDLIVLSRAPQDFLNRRAPHLRNRVHLSFIQGELTNFTYPAGPISHILHIASESNPHQSSEWDIHHVNSSIHGTQHLLDMAVEKQVDAVLITTSGAVYASTEKIVDGRFQEGPNGIGDYSSERIVYGQSKRMIEVMTAVTAKTHNFRALIARCFCFVGPYLSLEANYAVGNFIRDALNGRPIAISGDGSPLRSYLYPTDLIIWLMTILFDGKSGLPYNIGGEEAVSIAQLANIVANQAEYPCSVEIAKAPSNDPINKYLPDLSRSKSDLGLRVTVELDEAIKRTMIWHQKRLNN